MPLAGIYRALIPMDSRLKDCGNDIDKTRRFEAKLRWIVTNFVNLENPVILSNSIFVFVMMIRDRSYNFDRKSNI